MELVRIAAARRTAVHPSTYHHDECHPAKPLSSCPPHVHPKWSLIQVPRSRIHITVQLWLTVDPMRLSVLAHTCAVSRVSPLVELLCVMYAVRTLD
jgi:hypothetical protein